MNRLLQALADMRLMKLKGDRDPIQVNARRGVIAGLCSVLEKSRHEGRGPNQGRRLFTRDESIALGTLFFLAMREIGMHDVMSSSERLAAGLQERLLRDPRNLGQIDGESEEDLIDAAENLSNGIVTQLEWATGEPW